MFFIRLDDSRVFLLEPRRKPRRNKNPRILKLTFPRGAKVILCLESTKNSLFCTWGEKVIISHQGQKSWALWQVLRLWKVLRKCSPDTNSYLCPGSRLPFRIDSSIAFLFSLFMCFRAPTPIFFANSCGLIIFFFPNMVAFRMNLQISKFLDL